MKLMTSSIVLLFFYFSLLFEPDVDSQSVTFDSPNGTVEITFYLDDGSPFYSVSRLNRPVIEKSRLGMDLRNSEPLGNQMVIENMSRSRTDVEWEQPWGETRFVRNRYNELKIHLSEQGTESRKLVVVFRAFDDGIGFRYEWPEQDYLSDFEIMDEWTEFNLSGDPAAWWIPAYQDNRYEFIYQKSRVSELDTVHTPVTFETEDGLYLAIHEAALTDYSSMTLARTQGTILEADLVPWSDGVKVKASTPQRSSWRTIQISDTPGGLLESNLVLNLNEPNKLDDTSWIKPGKYAGIWWEMHLGTSTWGSGPDHGATTENALRYIDFAAENRFNGVLVEGWNIGWDGEWIANGEDFDFTTAYPDFNIERVTEYANERGTRLIGHHETSGAVTNYENQLEDAFAFYEQLGVREVKTGYVDFGQGIERIDENGDTTYEWHHGQYMVRHFQSVVETAARHKIMINVHEPIKDTGLRRTWPNFLSREGARGQEYNSREGGGNGPEHTTVLPFTRMLSGPMDFTPGIFDLTPPGKGGNSVETTIAKQLALYVVLYSPIQMAADLPENYRANPEPFKFIQDVPTDWDETKVIHGDIGNYITIVRKDRNSSDWYLGSITDDTGRMLSTPLYFLEDDITYVAEIYADGDDADWSAKPLDIEIESKLVNSRTLLTLRLAPGGGQAIRFRPANDRDIDELKWY
jgi:alpha-glucosidase